MLLKLFLRRRPSFPTYAITTFVSESASEHFRVPRLHFEIRGAYITYEAPLAYIFVFHIHTRTHPATDVYLKNKGTEEVEKDLSWNCKCEQQEVGVI